MLLLILSALLGCDSPAPSVPNLDLGEPAIGSPLSVVQEAHGGLDGTALRPDLLSYRTHREGRAGESRYQMQDGSLLYWIFSPQFQPPVPRTIFRPGVDNSHSHEGWNFFEDWTSELTSKLGTGPQEQVLWDESVWRSSRESAKNPGGPMAWALLQPQGSCTFPQSSSAEDLFMERHCQRSQKVPMWIAVENGWASIARTWFADGRRVGLTASTHSGKFEVQMLVAAE